MSVEGLTVGYGNATILQDVDFHMDSGDLLGVIGPNGAGKSTLVRALCGQLVPKAGTLSIAGHTVKPRQERRHLVGLVPQTIGLYPHLSGRENLHAFARLLAVPAQARDAAVTRALDLVDMTDRAHFRVSRMSGGMQRRINVAAAILSSPPLVIFDEPTAGVDQPARDTIHRLAKRLADLGHAVMIVTHELEQAEAICSRVLVLERGRVVGFGHPATLLSQRFADTREVVLRLLSPPDTDTLAALRPFGFKRASAPTVFIAQTQASEVSFVSAFMAGLRDRDTVVREVTVRRPGLASLMQSLRAA